MAADMAKVAERCRELGCFECKYEDRGYKTCSTVVERTDIFSKCPYKVNKEV